MTAPSTTISSTQSSTSRNTSSTTNPSSSSRQQKSTASALPTIPQNPPKGLSAQTKLLAQQLLHPNPIIPAISDDHTVLFSNGLQWLLDTATEAERAADRRVMRGTRLTEDAVRMLDEHGRHNRVKEVGETESIEEGWVDRQRIDAWVDKAVGKT